MDKEPNSNAYDAAAKEVLSNRDLLALLLQSIIPEFTNFTVNEIKENCFVHLGKETGNFHRGLNVEDNDESMGKIRYDLLYEFKYPNSDKTFLINIEMQRKRIGFRMLVNRSLYYLCRLVSRQSNIDFVEGDYKNMKPVYGVWLLPYFKKSFAVEYPMLPNMLYGKLGDNRKQKLVKIVFVGIGNNDTPENKLGKALYILFRSDYSDTMKEKELNKLGIYFTTKEWEGVVKMHWAEEYWTQKGEKNKSKIIALKMLKKNKPLNEIEEFTEIPVQSLKKLAKQNNIVI